MGLYRKSRVDKDVFVKKAVSEHVPAFLVVSSLRISTNINPLPYLLA
jgi:hypothetical protein